MHLRKGCVCVWNLFLFRAFPDSKPHGANMEPTRVLSAPDGSHVGPMNLAIWVIMRLLVTLWRTLAHMAHLRSSEVTSHAYLSLYTECMCCTHKTATFILPNIPNDFIILYLSSHGEWFIWMTTNAVWCRFLILFHLQTHHGTHRLAFLVQPSCVISEDIEHALICKLWQTPTTYQ